MAEKVRLANLIRGDTWDFNFNFTDSDGDPIDLTSYEFYFTVRTSEPTSLDETDSTALIKVDKKTHNLDGDDPENGVIILRVPYTETRKVENYTILYYDVQIVISGRPYTVFYGTMSIKKDITMRIS